MSLYLEAVDSLCKVLKDYGTTEYDNDGFITFKSGDYKTTICLDMNIDNKDRILFNANIGNVIYCQDEKNEYPIEAPGFNSKLYEIAIIKNERIHKVGGILRLAADIIDNVNFFRSRNITTRLDER